MQYREFEKLNIKSSLLGFGCMRFPKTADGTIDEPQAEAMLHEAIASGVNYIDTAYPYHDGKSEPFVGKVLKHYPRDSFYLATKMPIWIMKTKADVDRIFNEQLERLQVDYVDFYLLHALDKNKWQTVQDLGILDYVISKKQEGKIKYIGFSFHDDYDVFETIVNAYDWDFCQIQYNYMDTEIQAGDRGYKLCEQKGIPMVIMEPIKGGSLATLPEDIDSIFKTYNPNASTASWALRWVASHPNVKVILSGMSTPAQTKDNLETFSREDVCLNHEEMQVVNEVVSKIKARVKNGCTACGYCMPCPFGINIPKNFALWNNESMYGNTKKYKADYQNLKDAMASMCKQCGKCETMCPQHIHIRADLKKVAEDLGE